MTSVEPFLRTITEELGARGLDLVLSSELAPIAPDCAALDVELFGRRSPLGLLIGNTRAMWPHFLTALREQPDLARNEHPLDTWIEQCIGSVTRTAGVECRAYYGHQRQLRGYLPLQRWAARLGLLALSPSHLSVHREYGPWIALRALVVCDADCDAPREARPPLDGTASGEPCGSCQGLCGAPFERAARESVTARPGQRVIDHWQSWLAVRDACPVGVEHRYSEEQIAYHYARIPPRLQR